MVDASIAAAERTFAVVLRTSPAACDIYYWRWTRANLFPLGGTTPLAGHCTPATALFQLVLGRRVARCCTIGCDQEDTFQQRFTNRPGADEFAAVARPLVPGTSEC